MKGLGRGERSRWGKFPRVIRNGDLGQLKEQPEYTAAKGGDAGAALDMVDRLVTDEMIEQIEALLEENKNVRVLPVLAAETAGNNKIPVALAEVLSDRLGMEVETGIVQREKIQRTDSSADYRLAFNPTFDGSVKPGQKYLVVDDTLTMGGTVASLRGYVENRGGKAVGAAVMTAHPGALDLAVKPSMLDAIEKKHGKAMDKYWTEVFGYGIDSLTQGEAGHLKAAASVEAIRDRISAARHAGIERLDEGRAQTTERGGADLIDSALGLEREQQALLEAAPVEQSYQEALSLYVQAKHEQVEHIEERLEGLIDRQQASLAQSRSNPPGLLSRPSTKRAWQTLQARQRARIQTLHSRLDAVREVKEGMGLHSPRIEELATRKLRAERPELAADWDAMRESLRRHQMVVRKQEQEQKQAREHSRGQSLAINRPK
ncbi:phosphoribosyltransferase [Shewanella indica]|uniref:Phosphoribosyltransferase n=1 Tax=Shewanella indica TaxID=768528 RepID=A0ABU4QK54_9GAMM|nr:phosphoribosyltransferase [Shewanella indica]MDX6018618.1 phosphoribosyltransferase [Shewanella indica]MDX6018655.1 phosphoribosyltransferase [Shewanella indica]